MDYWMKSGKYRRMESGNIHGYELRNQSDTKSLFLERIAQIVLSNYDRLNKSNQEPDGDNNYPALGQSGVTQG